MASSVLYAMIGVGAVVLIASQFAPDESPAPAAPVAETSPAAKVPEIAAPPAAAPAQMIGAGGAVELARAPDGHFYGEALVNGMPVRFLIDTGASGVVLTRDDATRAGIGAGDFTAEGRGASGPIKLQPVVLARLALGPAVADNVPAMVADEGLSVSLLGQSFLARWGEVRIAGDRLTLR